jgi:hypothetical protein
VKPGTLLWRLTCASFLASGAGGVILGISRLQLPYEDGRFFDAREGVVYHLQAAEVYLIAGAVLMAIGLFGLVRSFRSGNPATPR